MELCINHNIRRYDGVWQELTDQVVVEKPLTLYLNGSEFVTVLCSPLALNYLIVGFLFSEGIVSGPADIRAIDIDEKHLVAQVETSTPEDPAASLAFKRTLTTGCGRGAIFYNTADAMRTLRLNDGTRIAPQAINPLMRRFHECSLVFRETGGTHACALADAGKIIYFHEDIGRHNALDKIIGQCLLAGTDPTDKLVLTSGRLSSEMVLKSAKARIPFVVSKGAPTDLAIRAAEAVGITLVGFVRGKRMNVYTGDQRLLPGGGDP